MTRAERRFYDLTDPSAGFTPIQLVQRFARHDAQIFVEHVLEDEKRLGTITLAPTHRAIVDHTRHAWEHGHRAINMSPPGSGKTSLLIGCLAFVLGNDVSLRSKLVSASHGAAAERVSTLGRIISNNLRFRAVFPECRPGEQWADGRLVLERPAHIRDATCEAYGATSKTQGARADVLALDDLDDDDTAHSARRREKTGRGFYEKFLSRGERSTRLVMIATRWHDGDVIGCLLAEATQRALTSFLWVRAITCGALRGRCMQFECLLPGEHRFLRFAFVHGLGWAPIKADFLAGLRDAA